MIAILDYGAGNLTSVANVLEHLGHPYVITQDPQEILSAKRLIFPGVGAAGSAMDELKKRGLDLVLSQFVQSQKPVLGICVGCQILLDHSDENGGTPTLGLISGLVKKFDFSADESAQHNLKIPHMGWNQVHQSQNHVLWSGIPDGSEFYFVHSYYPELQSKQDVAATSTYGSQTFDAAFIKNNVIATQFHAEKSGEWGLKLVDNFCKWTPNTQGEI